MERRIKGTSEASGYLTGKGKHLTEQERYQIWKRLNEGFNFKEIGEVIGKDPSTISKEIKKHRYLYPATRHGDIRDHPCHLEKSCKKRHICEHKKGKCRIPCRKCLACHRYCPDFKATLCDVRNVAPYVCNGCENHRHRRCKEDKYFYGPEQAQREYRNTLSISRQGADSTKDEMAALQELVTPLIRKGQPLNHIYAHHKDEMCISQRSFYRYVNNGYIGIKNIDLRRVVRYKPRRRSRPAALDPRKKKGHTWEYFKKYSAENPGERVTEMDLVEGSKGGKLMRTLFLRDLHLMHIALVPNKEMETVAATIDDIEMAIGTESFTEILPLILTDNGTEFADPQRYESNVDGVLRTKLYYCEPYRSNQKSRLEKNHEYIRYILPKGKSFDGLTEENVIDIMNHINSTARPKLGGKSPMELALRVLDENILKKLGMRLIPADEVCLTSDLIRSKKSDEPDDSDK